MKIVLASVGVAALLGIGVWLYSWYQDGQVPDLVYEQSSVERGNLESVVIATGELQPVNEIVVGSEISGQISELHVDFNDGVAAGDVLARIDPRTFEARLQQRVADVESAQANILSREAELSRAKSNLRQSTRQWNRNQDLKQDGHISESQLDNDLNQLESSQSALSIAESQIVTAKSALTQAEAALAQAELDVERTYIRSPVAGTVISRTVEIGQTVAASLQAPELFIIANDLRQMQVEASVDEADIGSIDEGMICRFSVDAYPERQFQGSIEQVRKAPTVTANVVTYKVIITARNADLALLPGMTANVEIVLGQRSDVLKVSNSALRYQPKEGIEVVVDEAAAGETQPRSTPSRNGFPGSGPRGGSNQLAMLQQSLDLSTEQVTKIEKVYSDFRDQMRARFASAGGPGGGGFGGGGGPPGGRPGTAGGSPGFMDQMRSQINSDIEKVLTPEQKIEFRKLTSGRVSQRRETVYVLSVDGTHIEKSIVVGLQDDSSAEVIRGLEEGEQVIVRARRIS